MFPEGPRLSDDQRIPVATCGAVVQADGQVAPFNLAVAYAANSRPSQTFTTD